MVSLRVSKIHTIPDFIQYTSDYIIRDPFERRGHYILVYLEIKSRITNFKEIVTCMTNKMSLMSLKNVTLKDDNYDEEGILSILSRGINLRSCHCHPI